jgi:hypothetical protein
LETTLVIEKHVSGVVQSFNRSTRSWAIYGVEFPYEAGIGAAASLEYSEHPTKDDISVELRLSRQQICGPVWVGNLVVIDESNQGRARFRNTSVPRMHHSGARLVNVADRRTLRVRDSFHDVASRLPGAIIDDDHLVGNVSQAGLREARIDASSQCDRSAKSWYNNAQFHDDDTISASLLQIISASLLNWLRLFVHAGTMIRPCLF